MTLIGEHRDWRHKLTLGAVLALVLGLFALFKWWYAAPRFSDGNVYIYLAQAISQGRLPYQDFFYSSPPVLLYVYAGWGMVWGFTWQAFHGLTVFLAAVEASLIYMIASRWSRTGGLLATIIYLTSFLVLATTDFAADVHLVVTLFLLAWWAQIKNWPWLAGLITSLAVLTKLYAIIPLLGLFLVWMWRRKWREAVIYAGSSVFIIGVAGAITWRAGGENFWPMVWTSHWGTIEGISKGRIWRFFLEHDPLLVAALPLAIWLRKKIPADVLMPFGLMMVFLIGFQDVYYMYFKIMGAILAVSWGWVFTRLKDELGQAGFIVAAAAVVLMAFGWSLARYNSEQAQAAIIDGLDGITESVREQVIEGEVLYGDFEIAPLVATGAEKKIWRDLADTNSKFFQTGYFDYEGRGRMLVEDKVKTVVTKGWLNKEGRLLAGPERVAPITFFKKHCQVVRVWPINKDYSHNAVLMWKCSY